MELYRSDKLNLILLFLTHGPIVFYCKDTSGNIDNCSLYITLTYQFHVLIFRGKARVPLISLTEPKFYNFDFQQTI